MNNRQQHSISRKWRSNTQSATFIRLYANKSQLDFVLYIKINYQLKKNARNAHDKPVGMCVCVSAPYKSLSFLACSKIRNDEIFVLKNG